MAAEEMMRFGLKPKAALLSHSQLRHAATSRRRVKMRETLDLLREQAPWLEVDGEMHGDVALDAPVARTPLMPHSTLTGDANLLVLPEHRRRQHLLQPAEDGGRRQHRHRPGAARRGQAGAHPDAVAPRCAASST